MLVRWSYDHLFFFNNDCTMIVTNFVNKILLRGKNTSYNDIVRCSYKHRTIIVRPLYEHRNLTMIVQSLYNNRTRVVRSSLYIYFFTTQQWLYNHRTTIVQPSYNHRTTIVRWSYKRRTMIVQLSYNHRTTIAKLIAKVKFLERGEVERWRRDGGARASAGPAGVFAWWRGVPAGGVTNR
jgi:hypothetical protein